MFGTMLTTTGYNDLAILSSIVPPLALALVSYIETHLSIMSSCCVINLLLISRTIYNKMPNYMLIPDCVVGELNALWNATSISVLVLRVALFLQEEDHFYTPDLLINHCQWEGLKMTGFFFTREKSSQ